MMMVFLMIASSIMGTASSILRSMLPPGFGVISMKESLPCSPLLQSLISHTTSRSSNLPINSTSARVSGSSEKHKKSLPEAISCDLSNAVSMARVFCMATQDRVMAADYPGKPLRSQDQAMKQFIWQVTSIPCFS